MYPVLFRIGNFALHSYGVMAAIGFLLACRLVEVNCGRAKMTAGDAATALVLAMISGIIGSRVFYVVQFFDEYYRDNLWEIIRIDHGGLVFYGGFLLAIAVLAAFAHWKKINFISMLDIFTPAMAAAHACGRIGCFLNGCCFGTPTGSWIGVHYPAGSEAALFYNGAALHPTQLYEAAFHLVMCPVYFKLVRKAPRGAAIGSLLLCYGLFRFIIEFLRGDNARLWGLFTQAQFIGLVLMPVGLITVLIALRLGKNAAKR